MPGTPNSNQVARLGRPATTVHCKPRHVTRETDLVGWLKRRPSEDTEAAANRAAREILDTHGARILNNLDELRKTRAALSAFGILNLPRNERELVDLELSNPAIAAIAKYRGDMVDALSTVALDAEDAAPRDAKIFGARRALIAGLPTAVTAQKVLEIDRALGLPPIDPGLGVQTG